jgi:acyl-CoA thioesterase-1
MLSLPFKIQKLSLIFLLILLPISSSIAAESLKIMLYGDSLMAGYGLNQSENLSTALQSKIDNDGIKARIINASVSGNTSSNGLSRLEWSLGDGPDIVVLCLGANDMLRGLDPEQTKYNLESIITIIHQGGAEVILAGMNSPINMGAKYQQQFDQIYPQLASKHGLVFMPFLLDGVALNKKYLLKDFKHPNELGIKIITNNLYPYILQAIDK